MKRSPKREKEVLFEKVKGTIQPIRRQGDPPEEDIEAMDGYICDLCLARIKRSELIQCPFCGRWVCRSQCYAREDLCCVSCAGVIRLMRESIVLGELRDSRDEKKADVKIPSKKGGK